MKLSFASGILSLVALGAIGLAGCLHAGAPAAPPDAGANAVHGLVSPDPDELVPDLARQLLAVAPTSRVPVVLPPDPGPHGARGLVFVNGKPTAGIKVQIVGMGRTSDLVTDAQGYFRATGLPDGLYQGYYYNASDRNKIGYWRSRPQRCGASSGAQIPAVDLYGVGMTNLPKMDATVSLPVTFNWVLQAQPVDYCYFRVHDHPFTSFKLVYIGPRQPGDTSSYTWDANGIKLDRKIRYFWGFQWDAGPVGMGGNLYQAAHFMQ